MTGPENRQAGVPLSGDQQIPAEQVASGDRRDVHLEPDPDQLVVARFSHKPDAPLPPQEQSAAADKIGDQPVPPVQDVAVSDSGPSVWDARPPSGENNETSGTPAGH